MGPSKRAIFGRRCAEKSVFEVLKSIWDPPKGPDLGADVRKKVSFRNGVPMESQWVPPKGPDLGAKCAGKYVPWVPISLPKNLKLAPLDFPRLQVPKVLH